MTRKPNKQYWQERAAERLATVERGTEKYLNETQKLFENASKQISADIERIIGNFAKNADITFDEARKMLREPLPGLDLEALKRQALAIEDGTERARAMLQVNAPAYRARISRLEGIKLSTQFELTKLAPTQTQIMENALAEAADESYMRTVFDLQRGTGLGYSFKQVSENQIEEVMKQNWSGRHYSKRVWDNTEVLAERVKNTIQQNMITGRSWKRSLGEVSDIIKTGGQYSARRLMQTETAYVANEMEAQAYEDADLDEYEYCATLDGKTSQKCQETDGKVFKLKDRKPGVNYPPLHAHCRSTTVAVIDGMDTRELQRRSRDPDTGENRLVPADMKYEDWINMPSVRNIDIDGIIKIDSCKNISEITEYIKTKWKVSDIDLKGLDYPSVRDSLANIETLAINNPSLRILERMQRIEKSKHGIMAVGPVFDNNLLKGYSLHFNPSAFKAGDNANFIAKCTAQGDMGNWVKNALPKTLSIHESAHAIDMQKSLEMLSMGRNDPSIVANASRGDLFMTGWNDPAGTIFSKDVIGKALLEYKALHGNIGIVEFRKTISRYANTNNSECWAEALQDVFVNGDQAAEASKLIVKHSKVVVK